MPGAPDAGWTAIVPLKPPGQRKTRLRPGLDQAARDALAEALFRHVATALGATRLVGEIVLLAAAAPAGWAGGWQQDQGRGLNAELEAARRRLDSARLLVIHADLPLLRPADIEALLAGRTGCAIAPDRHRAGTNALALRGRPGFAFGFGPGSFQRHLRAGGATMRCVERIGLSLDIDVPEDLDLARSNGFRFDAGTAGRRVVPDAPPG